MALEDHAHSGPLPCGVLLDDLIAQITEGAEPLDRAHQAACRYCEAALEAIRQAWEEFQSLARSAVAIPDDLADRIMERVRSLGRVSDEGVLIAGELGQTRIGHPVVGRLARRAAQSVDGVIWATVSEVGEDRADVGSVWVSLRLVVALGPAIDEVAGRVRERVIAEIEGGTGASVARVDVAVEDVAVAD